MNPRKKIMNGDEFQALIEELGPDQVHLYDPASQTQVVNQRLMALDLINEKFCRDFRTVMFGLIRRNADIICEGVRYDTYSQFDSSQPSLMSYNVFTMRPLKGNAILLLSPEFVLMSMDIMYGGTGRIGNIERKREFTVLENEIIKAMTESALKAYEGAWSAVYPVETEYLRNDILPKFTNITNSPNEVVVNTIFEVDFGIVQGQQLRATFGIALPYTPLSLIKSEMTNIQVDHEDSNPEQWSSSLRTGLNRTGVEVSVNYGYIASSLAKLASLQPGDILELDEPIELTATAENVPLFTGRPVASRNKVSLHVNKLYDHSVAEAVAKLKAAQTVKSEDQPDE
ncbi:flagellar motor switch protein FliM [Pseudomonas nitritireducens]|uniref:Flagellar motor switch protein FliM n=1 Tax=Pseudomonas nitroreducens TaxID=46680 RepID=A0A7W7KM77_PSENT|nr:FliM/FliN family flagellar motor switch protein [Pseudomonas nitritireducens]MBB4865392.1 flagellar motor switch protein FliM [Pseudomonas nitritireducens]